MTHGSKVHNYHLKEKLLYHIGKLYIPTKERIHVIIDAHTSPVSCRFSVGKTLSRICRGFSIGLT